MGFIDKMMGGKTSEQRQAKAMNDLDKISQGKGLAGRLTKAFVTEDQFASLQATTQTIHDGQAAATALQSGAPVIQATIVSVQQANAQGRNVTVNNSPQMTLVVNVPDTSPAGFTSVTIEAIVSLAHVPQVGQVAALTPNPAVPGGYLYLGVAG